MNTARRRLGTVTVGGQNYFALTGTNILNTMNTYGHVQLKEKDIVESLKHPKQCKCKS